MTEQANRAQLELIISGLAEGVLLVEPDQSITYANSAALSMHGVGTLSELGETVDAYRHNFVLHYRNNHLVRPGAYPIERVAAGGMADDVVVKVSHRVDPARNWCHRIRSLVLTKPDGAPRLLVLLITDVSEQFEAEDRFERTFAANPAPALICRLADQRFIKVNEGFLELTSFDRDAVLGRTLYDLDVLNAAKRRDLALERLRAGQTIPQMEAECPAVDGTRHVVVAGQPLEVDDEPCMLFTFADLEPHYTTAEALRASEERFIKSFRLAPIPMALAKLEDERILDINEAFCATMGLKTVDVIGRTAEELRLWADPDSRARFTAQLRAEGAVHGYEATLRGRDGVEIVSLVSADTVEIAGEACVICAFLDISARKRSERELMAAIEAVMQDASWLSQAIVEKLAALRAPSPTVGAEPRSVSSIELTPRERDVMHAICRGERDAAMAEALGLSIYTVRNHIAGLYRKLGISRRSEVIVWARERGIDVK